MSKPSFFAELQRRHVYKVGAMYAVAGWLLVQVITQVFPIFHIAESIQRGLVLLIIAGFPVALVLAWLFDLTPEGIVRTSERTDEGEAPTVMAQRRGMERKLNVVLGVLVVIGVAYFVAERTILRASVQESAAAAAPGIAKPGGASSSAVEAKSIAVLPFTDLSPTHDQEYFSDGMAEELLNALAKVKDLKVAGRTSSFSFKGKNEDLREIGRALGVSSVLEGSVRKQGEKVRITAQLIQTDNGFHLWSESYDGDLKDVFELQERIARAITDALQVVLVGAQQQRLVPVATENPEAYSLFLKATTIFNQRDGGRFPEAIAALEQAIRLDFKFARAYSKLAAVYAIAPSYTTIKPKEAAAAVEREAQAAQRLDPTLAEPIAAQALAYAYARRWGESLAKFNQAVALDPSDETATFWLAETLFFSGYSKKSTALLDRTLAIDPLLPNALYWRGMCFLWSGDRTRARALLEQARDAGLRAGEQGLAFVDHEEGHDAEARRELANSPPQTLLHDLPADISRLTAAGVFGDAVARRQVLAMIDRYVASGPEPISGAVPWALLLLGEPARALALAHDSPTSNDVLLLFQLWSPYGRAARQLPQFAEFARAAGLADVWDQYGPPDFCQRRAPRDYVCE